MSSLPPWKNVYKSGRWPDPNNNLLRACLPRHNALQSKAQPRNMATSLLNPVPFFHFPKTAVPSTTWPCCLFRCLTLSIFLYQWHEIASLFFFTLYSRQSMPGFAVMPQEQSVSFQKETSTFWKMWHLFWHDHAGMKAKKWRLNCLLLFTDKKGSTVEAVIIFKERCFEHPGHHFSL